MNFSFFFHKEYHLLTYKSLFAKFDALDFFLALRDSLSRHYAGNIFTKNLVYSKNVFKF